MFAAAALDPRPVPRVAVASFTLALLAACSSANERFEAFEHRRAAFPGQAGASSVAGAAGENAGCAPPPPGAVSGPALMALETSTMPGKAILFYGEVRTPELNGGTAVEYRYRALDQADRRTLVGDALTVGPYPIAEDGRFDAPTEKSTLPGRANALLPGVDITSELTLHGTICGVSDFYCGTVTGTVYSPIEGPTTGQFGLLLLNSIEDLPERPRYGCDDAARAPAL
jgi:hypothetical protein